MVLFYSVVCSGKRFHFDLSTGKIWQNSFWIFPIDRALHWKVGGVLAFVYLYVSGK